MSPPATSNERPIHILFVGAGAIGCFYASRLHHPSENIHVSLVCRSNYSTVLRSGVDLQTRDFGNYNFRPYAVYASAQEAGSSTSTPKSGWDYIVVTTKALPDVIDDSETIAPAVCDTKTCILLIQNGFGIEEPHRKRFPRNPIISAVTVASAELINPGTVRQNRWTRISLGPYGDGVGGRTPEVKDLAQRGAERVVELVRILTDLGKLRDADPYDETGLQTVRWHKICINGSMNPSSILSGGHGPAHMTADPEMRSFLKACMEEVFDAAPAVLGKPFDAKMAKPEQILTSAGRNTGAKPSMLIDWEMGKPMELEVILGNPVRIAKERGFVMPRLQGLYALLKSQQRTRDERIKVEKEVAGSKI